MFQFPGFASWTYGFSPGYRRSGGLPHSEIHGSKPARGSPWLIATCCVLHRLSVPRHPPDALQTLDLILSFERHAQEQTRPWSLEDTIPDRTSLAQTQIPQRL